MKTASISTLAAILLVSVPAFADKAAAKATSNPPDIAELIPPKGPPSGAAFAFVGNAVYTNATAQQMAADLPGPHVAKNVVGGYSKNKRAYWACADIASSGGQLSLTFHGGLLILDFLRQLLDSELLTYQAGCQLIVVLVELFDLGLGLTELLFILLALALKLRSLILPSF